MPAPSRVLIAAALTAGSAATAAGSARHDGARSAPDRRPTLAGALPRPVLPAVPEPEGIPERPAEGRGGPRAVTLIGDRDTAIPRPGEAAGDGLPDRTHLMTPRGQAPIPLAGCCEPRP